MPIVYVDRNGPPGAMLCPLILCDACDTPINPSGGMPGLVLFPRGHDATGRPTPRPLYFVHQRACCRSVEAAIGKRCSSIYIREFLEQLTGNYEDPIEPEDNVEYVAPRPSRWRIGQYRRVR